LKISIEGGKSLRLLLDTGASGILLTQSAIDKAGLSHLGATEVRGVGDKGARGGFFAIAEFCAIEKLKYKTCMLGATEGKKGIVDEDGLIGTDVFSDYLVTIDFQRHTLHLLPLPERPPSPQGYDRAPLPSESAFTPVFRFGPHLYVSTKVNGKSTGLFLLDTGSGLSAIDSTFARLTTKIGRDESMRVRGISGSVDQVFEADKAELQFSRFRQSVPGLTSFNLNNGTEHQQVRMDGILGFSVLILFRLSLDYRNGLVNFDYVLEHH
jgi:predicted aspartyl protease